MQIWKHKHRVRKRAAGQQYLPHGSRHLAAANQGGLRLDENRPFYREVAHLVQQLRLEHLLGGLQAGGVVPQYAPPVICCHFQIHHLYKRDVLLGLTCCLLLSESLASMHE